MSRITLTVNGQQQTVDVEPDTPLLWVLRDTLGLTGTKFGCGKALCGSCTVHVVNGTERTAVRSCAMPASAAAGADITTIEGLSASGDHPVQQASIEENVPQCGYCQPGQIMAAAALLSRNPTPDDSDIDEAMRGVLCRCGTHVRIRRAIHRVAGQGSGPAGRGGDR